MEKTIPKEFLERALNAWWQTAKLKLRPYQFINELHDLYNVEFPGISFTFANDKIIIL